MSDRGYIALSLEIQAKAIEARIEGMKADNQQRISLGLGDSLNYQPENFFAAEQELNTIAAKIRELVG